METKAYPQNGIEEDELAALGYRYAIVEDRSAHSEIIAAFKHWTDAAAFLRTAPNGFTIWDLLEDEK